MFVYKIEKESIPSEEITTKTDYYVIDPETAEYLAYSIKAQGLDAVSDIANEFKNAVFGKERKSNV